MLTIDNKLNILRQISLFDGLSTSELQVIAGSTEELDFPANEVIIEQDDESDCAYIIVSGSARVYRLTEDGEEVNLAILGKDQVLGEMALLDKQPRSANVESVQPIKVLKLTRTDFSRILHQHPDTAINLLSTLSTRVRSANEHLEDVFSKNLEERTWKMLQTLAHYFPNQQITLSQEELATMVGATRARVTEVLADLADTGKITLAHRKIQVI